MSESKRNPKLFRESLAVINHPKSLILSPDFFNKRETKNKDVPNKHTVKEEYTEKIMD